MAPKRFVIERFHCTPFRHLCFWHKMLNFQSFENYLSHRHGIFWTNVLKSGHSFTVQISLLALINKKLLSILQCSSFLGHSIWHAFSIASSCRLKVSSPLAGEVCSHGIGLFGTRKSLESAKKHWIERTVTDSESVSNGVRTPRLLALIPLWTHGIHDVFSMFRENKEAISTTNNNSYSSKAQQTA